MRIKKNRKILGTHWPQRVSTASRWYQIKIRYGFWIKLLGRPWASTNKKMLCEACVAWLNSRQQKTSEYLQKNHQGFKIHLKTCLQTHMSGRRNPLINELIQRWITKKGPRKKQVVNSIAAFCDEMHRWILESFAWVKRGGNFLGVIDDFTVHRGHENLPALQELLQIVLKEGVGVDQIKTQKKAKIFKPQEPSDKTIGNCCRNKWPSMGDMAHGCAHVVEGEMGCRTLHTSRNSPREKILKTLLRARYFRERKKLW